VRAKYDLEAWLTRQPEGARKVGKYDVVVPGPVLAVLALLGLVVFSAAGAYIYYPEPAESLKQIHALRADVASAVAGARNASTDRARKRAEAVRELEQLDLAVRKLMVGTYIRKFALTAEQKEAADELREAIEEVRDELLTGDPEKAYALMRAELTTSSAALRTAFSNGSEP
jgi:DNA-binding GntR family transcriptional regulator